MYKVFLSDLFNVLVFAQPFGYRINDELVKFARQQQPSLRSYIFSNSSLETLERAKLQLVPPFIELFSTQRLGWPKSESDSYLKLAKKLAILPAEIIFTDDKPHHITAAAQAGVAAILFQSTAQFITTAKKLLQSP